MAEIEKLKARIASLEKSLNSLPEIRPIAMPEMKPIVIKKSRELKPNYGFNKSSDLHLKLDEYHPEIYARLLEYDEEKRCDAIRNRKRY